MIRTSCCDEVHVWSMEGDGGKIDTRLSLYSTPHPMTSYPLCLRLNSASSHVITLRIFVQPHKRERHQRHLLESSSPQFERQQKELAAGQTSQGSYFFPSQTYLFSSSNPQGQTRQRNKGWPKVVDSCFTSRSHCSMFKGSLNMIAPWMLGNPLS